MHRQLGDVFGSREVVAVGEAVRIGPAGPAHAQFSSSGIHFVQEIAHSVFVLSHHSPQRLAVVDGLPVQLSLLYHAQNNASYLCDQVGSVVAARKHHAVEQVL